MEIYWLLFYSSAFESPMVPEKTDQGVLMHSSHAKYCLQEMFILVLEADKKAVQTLFVSGFIPVFFKNDSIIFVSTFCYISSKIHSDGLNKSLSLSANASSVNSH